MHSKIAPSKKIPSGFASRTGPIRAFRARHLRRADSVWRAFSAPPQFLRQPRAGANNGRAPNFVLGRKSCTSTQAPSNKTGATSGYARLREFRIRKSCSLGLWLSWHPVVRMRVNVIAQFMRRNAPFRGQRYRDHIFGRRSFALKAVEPLPDMPLLHVATGHNSAYSGGQGNLSVHQFNCSR